MKKLELELKRIFTCPTYTIGHLYCNGQYVCDTIEDTDRGLTDNMSVSEIMEKKVYAKTAIPKGEYEINMNVVSPRFSQITYYKNFCSGKLPRLIHVKGFSGILIHRGSTADSSAGCIICGYNKVKGKVVDSKEAWEKLMNNYLVPARDNNYFICIKIYSTYE